MSDIRAALLAIALGLAFCALAIAIVLCLP
jgi:hypothetical protein